MTRRVTPQEIDAAQPVILLGAARSGTKLLRSIVASANGRREVPHDVNYVWRQAAPSLEHDVMPAECVTDRFRCTLAKQLLRLSKSGDGSLDGLVEKTVSNTLRLPFVNRVFPHARYIHLVRDGMEVTESAMRCWRAKPELWRLLGKMTSFPWGSCYRYAMRYAGDLARQGLTRDRTAPTWGPRYPGIDWDVTERPLAEVCAKQWLACYESVEQSKHLIPSERWLEVSYASLVSAPRETGLHIGEFIGSSDPNTVARCAEKKVSPHRRTSALSEEERLIIKRVIGPVLDAGGSQAA